LVLPLALSGRVLAILVPPRVSAQPYCLLIVHLCLRTHSPHPPASLVPPLFQLNLTDCSQVTSVPVHTSVIGVRAVVVFVEVSLKRRAESGVRGRGLGGKRNEGKNLQNAKLKAVEWGKRMSEVAPQ
jgi:hypothetical protein